eukprot:3673906-Prymnesium_polylepis.1
MCIRDREGAGGVGRETLKKSRDEKGFCSPSPPLLPSLGFGAEGGASSSETSSKRPANATSAWSARWLLARAAVGRG